MQAVSIPNNLYAMVAHMSVTKATSMIWLSRPVKSPDAPIQIRSAADLNVIDTKPHDYTITSTRAPVEFR